MKRLFSLILLCSSISAFSSDAGVLEAMKSMFREGTYTGLTPDKENCTVSFQFLKTMAVIKAKSAELKATRLVYDGTNYRSQPGRRMFLTSDYKSTFRSLAIDENLTYTVTAEINEYGEEVPVECVINL